MRRMAILAVLTVALIQNARAGDCVWIGGTGSWSQADNWTPAKPSFGDRALVNDGTLALAGSAEYCFQAFIGYTSGSTGTVDQASGSLAASWGVILGYAANSNYTYYLRGGTLSGGNDSVGYSGTGTFVQTGGVHSGAHLNLGAGYGSYGSYTLWDGVVSYDYDYVGLRGPGEFVQYGGTNNMNWTLAIGYYGTSPGSYTIQAGSLSAQYIDITYGNFTQNGGNVNLVYWSTLNSGDYRLNGGSLHANIQNIAKFSQTGGSNWAQTMTVGPGWGSNTYVFTAGDLTVDTLAVAPNLNYSGTLELGGPSARLTVSGVMKFGVNSRLRAAPSSSIRLEGTAFSIESTNAAQMSGLSELSLLVDNGAKVAQVEVAGRDAGADLVGWNNNFALAGLTVVGNVRLVDLFDNQPSWTGSEALYVTRLDALAGSTLDLNGLRLYYTTGSLDPSVTIIGGTPVRVPEPTMLVFLTLGGFAMLRRRNKDAGSGRRLT